MLTLGIDTHKRSHTVVAADGNGRSLGDRTSATTTPAHLDVITWARSLSKDRLWAIEDCRHLSRRLEQDLLAAGEKVVRVPPKLMANARDSARTFGKSDPIDALAVARAALREPNLPVAQLDGPAREIRLLVDHRESLVAERTRVINRVRWHLHELDPTYRPAARAFRQRKAVRQALELLKTHEGIVAELARRLLRRCDDLTVEISDATSEIEDRIRPLAPALLAIVGCGPLGAAKIVGETADITRFHSKDAYARHNGTAPVSRMVFEPRTSPAHPGREPPAQRRRSSHSYHPSPLPPTGAGLPRTTEAERRQRQRSHPSTQTSTIRRRLPGTPRRRQHRQCHRDILRRLT